MNFAPDEHACALWAGPRRLSAVLIEDDGALGAPLTVAASPPSAQHLLTYLTTAAGVNTLILAEASHSLIAKAHALGLGVRLVPRDLLEAIRTAAGLHHRAPRHTAVLIARCYISPTLRRQLRAPRVPAAAQPHQLELL